MKKNKLNKALTSKAFFIVISILVSITLWLYVVNVENTEVDISVDNIPVTFIGADDILADRQLMVKDGSTQTVSLEIRCKRSQMTKFNNNTIKVTVDLSDIRSTGQQDRSINVAMPDGIGENDALILKKSPEYVSVEIVKLDSKTVPVKGIHNGGPADGYMEKTMEILPETITIRGPEDEISKVQYAWVVIDRENLSKTITETKSYTLIDADGNEVVSDMIEKDVETVTVTVPVLMVKDVVLSVDLIEGAGASSKNTVVTIEPQVITLAGEAEDLENLNKITLGAIDLTKFETNFTQPYTIPIPNDVENVSKVTEATVTINITGVTVKNVLAKNITCANCTAGYTATVKPLFINVTIRGPKSMVDMVDTYNIRVVADLSGLGDYEGNVEVPAEVKVDGYSDVGVIGEYKVVVSVEKDEEGTS